MEEKIKDALMEAIWITRWNKDKTALKAVLKVKEANKMCKNILKQLDKAGFVILRKVTLDVPNKD